VSVAADVARAALCDVGRPDLAECVSEGRHGGPTQFPNRAAEGDWDMMRRAFLLGHLAAGHRDHFVDGRVSNGICCEHSGCPCECR
jgi:hypothetical protein